MTWNFIKQGTYAELPKELDWPTIQIIEKQNPGCTRAAKEAWSHVRPMIWSRAYGLEDREFTVQVGGHTNPLSKPVDGQSNDFVDIRISQYSHPPLRASM